MYTTYTYDMHISIPSYPSLGRILSHAESYKSHTPSTTASLRSRRNIKVSRRRFWVCFPSDQRSSSTGPVRPSEPLQIFFFFFYGVYGRYFSEFSRNTGKHGGIMVIY